MSASGNGRDPMVVLVVLKHNPGLHTYSWWKRWLVRLTYWVTGYQCSAQQIGVAVSDRQAREWLKDKNYCAVPVYLGKALGDDIEGPGPVIWGDPNINWFYERYAPGMVTLTRREHRKLRTERDYRQFLAQATWNSSHEV